MPDWVAKANLADRLFDLGRELQQQPVIGLLGDRLDPERQAVLMGCQLVGRISAA